MQFVVILRCIVVLASVPPVLGEHHDEIVNNLLNTLYIAELNTNSLNADGQLYTPNQVEFYTNNKGYYGFGRTWNFGIKLSF